MRSNKWLECLSSSVFAMLDNSTISHYQTSYDHHDNKLKNWKMENNCHEDSGRKQQGQKWPNSNKRRMEIKNVPRRV